MSRQVELVASRSINDILHKLKLWGIAILPEYLSQEVVETLNSEFDRSLCERGDSLYDRSKHPTNPDGKAARFNPYHDSANTEFPVLTETFQDNFMRQIAEAYYAPHPICFNEAVFITQEFPSDIPILPWHFDRIQALKFWFNLTDTTKENGAFEYCPGTHWEGRYRAGYHLSQGIPVEDIPNDIDEDLIRNPVSIEVKAGDLVIFDADGFHRGGIVQPGHERRVLRAHTYPRNGRRYGDRQFSAGWWLSSPLNLNRWLKAASRRIIGDRVQEHSVNRKKHDITK
jgi:hypothetical protein